jgi:hypothetical protein
MENRTSRLTILIDPRKKKLFEEICAHQDLNASQMVRKLMRQHMIDRLAPGDVPEWLFTGSARAE